MPELDSRYFQGSGPIPPDIRENLCVDSPTQISENAANRLGWDGNLAAAVIIQLSESGDTASRGYFALVGELTEHPIVIQASKLWEGASRDVNVSITVPTAEQFSFLDGTLCSDYIDHDEVDYVVSKGRTPILPPHYGRYKISGFSLRLVAHLSRGANGRGGLTIRLTLLAFPLNVDELRQECDATQSASWAGVRLLEQECPFFPNSASAAWGHPFYPLLYKSNARMPCTASEDELRAAVAAVMGTASMPTACTSVGAMRKFWTAMAADPEKAAPRAPQITWPKFDRPAAAQGNAVL